MFAKQWLGRSNEAGEMHRFLSTKHNQELGNGCLCLYGNMATGKSQLTVDLLRAMNMQYVLVDRLLYDLHVRGRDKSVLVYSLLVSQLIKLFINEDYNNNSDEEEDDDIQKREMCTNFPMFQSFVEKLVPVDSQQPVVFVIDDADYLAARTMFWDQFLSIKTLSKRNLRIILISREPIALTKATTICFQSYSPATCKAILLKTFDREEGEYDELSIQQQRDRFVALLDHAFVRFPQMVDLTQAAYTVRTMWRATMQAAQEEGEVDWRQFSHLRVVEVELTRKFRNVGNVYAQTKHLCKSNRIAEELDRIQARELDKQANALSAYGKALLFACYLAANNPKEHDRVLFGEKLRRKVANKKRRLENDNDGDAATSKEAVEEDNSGAHVFTLDRVKYLFSGLVADLWGSKEEISLYAVVDLLCHKRYIIRVGSDPLSTSSEKFKCAINFEFCEAVAKCLGLELNKYLFEARTTV